MHTRFIARCLSLPLLFWLSGLPISAAAQSADHEIALPPAGLFSRTNLVAWCIVPFDARKRGPEARAEMLDELGIRRLAYDYRAEHVKDFETEIETLRRHGIELTAWWFPTVMNDEARLILGLLKKHGESPQLWVMGSGEPGPTPAEHETHMQHELERIRAIALAAKEPGSTVGLYNHGGWFGQPANQIALIRALKKEGITNVGIVYNLHHGHEHIDRFKPLLEEMKPYLIAINLNGMEPEGDQHGKKIVPIGAGSLDSGWIEILNASGWMGPVGILNHTDEDAAVRLRENLEGLSRLCSLLPK